MTQLLRFSKQILSKPPYHHLISEYKIIYNIDDIYNKSFKTNPFKTSLSPSHCHPCLFYVEAKLDCLLFLLKNFCMGGSSISLYSSVSRAAQQDQHYTSGISLPLADAVSTRGENLNEFQLNSNLTCFLELLCGWGLVEVGLLHRLPISLRGTLATPPLTTVQHLAHSMIG